MTEDINHLKSANPEVYQKLKDMDITAASGYRDSWIALDSDDIVSTESQHGDILGELIDEKRVFKIDDARLSLDSKHLAYLEEVRDDDFVNLIQKVNEKEAK
ncbi:hypothetical protein HOO54_20935 [Bacillus sp. WMMC1349]|uniref:hypothetical protein n=1 Tax=Bacillus sp. WMMC1349 TaxID=2736254 RepID=UPI0015536C7F|nr:hypothetical protein [Bacillus sp. WMMC1349]NPC94623.1 hypothetical protein [Bacillus sp. WMMC1349]